MSEFVRERSLENIAGPQRDVSLYNGVRHFRSRRQDESPCRESRYMNTDFKMRSVLRNGLAFIKVGCG